MTPRLSELVIARRLVGQVELNLKDREEMVVKEGEIFVW